jgi:NitT/TauT family transport system substrate-binding protein
MIMNPLPPRAVWSRILLGMVAFATLCGCGKSAGNTPAQPGASANATTNPSTSAPLDVVRIGYFANLTHAQAVLGVSSGDFSTAVAPAALKPLKFNAGPELMQALFAGAIDIGYVGPGPVISAYATSHGQALRVIAGAAANGVLIVARKDGPVNSLADLAGHKLATPQLGNTQDISAKHYLRDVLKQTDLSNVAPIPNAQMATLMSRGQIDAAWVPEPWGSLLVSQTGARIVGEEKDLWPTKQFTLTLIVTTPEFLAAHPDVVKNVLAVHKKWTKLLTDAPDAQIPALSAALTQLTGATYDPAVLTTALHRISFTNDPLPDTLSTMATWTNELGFVDNVPDLDKLFDLNISRSLP